MSILVHAFLIGVIAGLRAIMPLAAVSWGPAWAGSLLKAQVFNFFSHPVTRYLFSIAAIGELINDKLPKTLSRKVPPQFIVRVISGGLSGAALGAAHLSLAGGLIAGILGAVVGTLGGAEVRSRLARAVGNDLPIALLEDIVAIAGAFLIVSHT